MVETKKKNPAGETPRIIVVQLVMVRLSDGEEGQRYWYFALLLSPVQLVGVLSVFCGDLFTAETSL